MVETTTNNNDKKQVEPQVPQSDASYEDFKELQKAQTAPASNIQKIEYDKQGNAIFPKHDTVGQPNKSRGVIGQPPQVNNVAQPSINSDELYKQALAKSARGINKGGVTEGTLFDRTNPPSKIVNNNPFTLNQEQANPKTIEELKQQLDNERQKGLLDERVEMEKNKMHRYEMQGFKYTAPSDLEGKFGIRSTPNNVIPDLKDSTGEVISITDEQPPPSTNVVEQIINPETTEVKPNQIKTGLDTVPSSEAQKEGEKSG